MNLKLPELLSPAGSVEKLQVAIHYGAHAVYLAGQQFGLRAAADNFDQTSLSHAVQYAHERKVKVYVTLNSFLHDSDLKDLPHFLAFLQDIAIDGVIVSDMGVATLVKKLTTIPLHISTQASVLSVAGAKMWQKLGADRIIVGRETSIADTCKIKKITGLEVEMFIHGSMCMAYSGHCVISNFTQGRDSNRGGCAHSCRFEYQLESEQQHTSQKNIAAAHFMSSKDLMGLYQLEQMIHAGIDSIKIEGRMKSELHAAMTTKIYAQALAYFDQHRSFVHAPLNQWEQQLASVPHRDFTSASLVVPAGTDSIYNKRDHEKNGVSDLAAIVLQNSVTSGLVLQVKRSFNVGDELLFLNSLGDDVSHIVSEMRSVDGSLLSRTNPSTVVILPYLPEVMKKALVQIKMPVILPQQEKPREWIRGMV